MGNNGEGHLEGFDDSEAISDEDRVVLVDAEGNEHPYVLLALIELDEGEYAVLGPEDQLTDPAAEEVELSFFRVVGGDNGDEHFEVIDDDDEFARVERACTELLGLAATDD